MRNSVRIGDEDRAYSLHLPAGSRAAPWPLVLLLHGEGDDSRDAMTLDRWIETSDLNGFVLVGLDARKVQGVMPSLYNINPRLWNNGDAGITQESIVAGDDVAYAAAVLDALQKRYTVDVSRVYAVGFGGGGSMAQRLGLELSERFAAIASVGGLHTRSGPPRNPLSVLLVYGRLDPVTPYNGGARKTPWGDWPPSPPVAGDIEAWTHDLHCPDAPQVAPAVDPRVERSTWQPCDGGTEVQAVTVGDLGHHWPGGHSDGHGLGPESNAYDATGAIWDFFAAHRRVRVQPRQ